MIMLQFPQRTWPPTLGALAQQQMVFIRARRHTRWKARWQDLVEFEVVPVVTSGQAAEAIAPLL